MQEGYELKELNEYVNDNDHYNKYSGFLNKANQTKLSIENDQLHPVNREISLCEDLLELFEKEQRPTIIAEALLGNLFNEKNINFNEYRKVPFEAIDELFENQNPTSLNTNESTKKEHEQFYKFLDLTDENKESDLFKGTLKTSFESFLSRINNKLQALKKNKETLLKKLKSEEETIERLQNDKERVEKLLQNLESHYIKALSDINTYLNEDNWQDSTTLSTKIIELVRLLDTFFEIQKNLPWGQENAIQNRFEIEYQKQIKAFNTNKSLAYSYINTMLNNFYALIKGDLDQTVISHIIEDLKQCNLLLTTKSNSPLFHNIATLNNLQKLPSHGILMLQYKIQQRVQNLTELANAYAQNNSTEILSNLSDNMTLLGYDLSLLTQLKGELDQKVQTQIDTLKNRILNYTSSLKNEIPSNDNTTDNVTSVTTTLLPNTTNPLNITAFQMKVFTESDVATALKVLGVALLLIGLLAALGSTLALTVPVITAALTTSALGIAKITLIAGASTMGVGALLLGAGLFKQKTEEREFNNNTTSYNK